VQSWQGAPGGARCQPRPLAWPVSNAHRGPRGIAPHAGCSDSERVQVHL